MDRHELGQPRCLTIQEEAEERHSPIRQWCAGACQTITADSVAKGLDYPRCASCGMERERPVFA